MNAARSLALLRVLALLAVAVSTALYLDYVSATPAFCGVGEGCEAVRYSGFGYIALTASLRVPLPLFGLIAYGVVLAVSAWGDLNVRRLWLLVCAGLGGVFGVAFLVVQAFVVGQFCKWCVVVDVTAIAIAVVAYRYARVARSPHGESHRLWVWSALGVLALFGPIMWPRLQPRPPVPEVIRALYEQDKINVIEFADFECPFCRLYHETLTSVMAAYPKDRIAFKRLNKPLAGHKGALPLAKIYVCGRQQNKAEEMANRLFSGNIVETLVRNGETDATALGLDKQRFSRCLADPATEQIIKDEAALLDRAGFQGLPTTYVQGTMILGAQPEPVVRAAFERAFAGDTGLSVSGPVYLSLLFSLAGALLWFGRRPSTPDVVNS